jgi:hypothetical protein
MAAVAQDIWTTATLHSQLQRVAEKMRCFISSHCSTEGLAVALDKLKALDCPTLQCRLFIETSASSAIRLVSTPSDPKSSWWLLLCPTFDPILFCDFVDRYSLTQPVPSATVEPALFETASFEPTASTSLSPPRPTPLIKTSDTSLP